MDRYHIHFYLVGGRSSAFETLRALPPLEGFCHTFMESEFPEAALAREADVVLVDLRKREDNQILYTLRETRRPERNLIVLATGEQANQVVELFPKMTDIWTGSLEEAELKFHFRKWQKDYALRLELEKEEEQMRQYQQSLVEKTRMLELLFSSLDCGVLCHSVDGRELVSVNDAALRMLGYDSREAMVADGFNLVASNVLEEDKPLIRQQIQSLRQVGDSGTAEYRVRHKGGEILHILTRFKLLEEKGQRYYQRFLVDFTDKQRETDDLLAKSDRHAQYHQRLLELFSEFLSDSIDDIYMLLDGSLEHIEFVTNNAGRVLGVPPEKRPAFLEQLHKVEYLSGGPVTLKELEAMEPGTRLKTRHTERVHPVTGEHRWFRERVYCVSVQGARKYVACIADRTAERKAQETLREALEIAQVANRAKSDFLSSVSHDIRTPMNAITGLTALLKDAADDPAAVLDYAQKISSASQHLLGLINDVLDMNKMESGSMVLNTGELSLAEIIDEANTVIRPQAKAREQHFEIFTNNSSHDRLLGDKLRINQILLNLLTNAVQYTPKGGQIEMWVTEQPQADPNYRRVRFTVSDNGPGISKEFQKIIFDPFTRELDTKINEVQGTGLGMAVTKSLVDLMEGTIQIISEPGQGSTFAVELELRILEEETEPPQPREAHPAAGHVVEEHRQAEPAARESGPEKSQKTEGILEGKRVMVVDDIEINRMILSKILTAQGAVCEDARNGQEAFEMFRHSQPGEYDLIMMDLQMPVMNGHEAARAIRACGHPSANSVAIIAMTANVFIEDVRGSLDAGMDAHIPKPIVLDQLKKTIAEVLERKRQDL